MSADLQAVCGPLYDGETVWPQATVLVQAGRVRAVGPEVQVPDGAAHTQARPGQTIIPGLIDLHVHARPHYAAWFAAAGVTSVRDAGGRLDGLAALRAFPGGPRIWGAGAILDGPGTVFRQFGPGVVGLPGDRAAGCWALETPAQATAAVTALAEAGADWVKLYEQLSPEVYRAAVRQAHVCGLPVMTDLGMRSTRGLSGARVDALEALQLGIGTLEHVSGFALAWARAGHDPASSFPDEHMLDSWAQAVVQAGAALVPTLGVHLGLAQQERADLSTLPGGGESGEVMASLQAQWTGIHAATASLRDAAAWDARLAAELSVRVLALGGVVGAGTDAPAGVDTLPGGGLHAELQHLVTHAGLSPQQALHAATGAAGRLLAAGEVPQVGVLRPGTPADLLLLDGDPLRDLSATRRLAGVMQAGEWRQPRCSDSPLPVPHALS
jgi:imidazolonepropionase-like amidohydrolase